VPAGIDLQFFATVIGVPISAEDCKTGLLHGRLDESPGIGLKTENDEIERI
jgi:hypothetical protein